MGSPGVILGTHAPLWMDCAAASLGKQARHRVDTAWRSGQVAVSAISFWEAAMLAERGHIALPLPVERWRSEWLRAGLVELPLDGRIALLSCQLENFHRDPADRFIVATALAHDVPLMTADQKILDWQGKLERLDARG